ncbi:MAG: exo-alpha-sialidase [Candidatus Lokiarchaeota archaeon]|nr:exo-alpha-sialidase [Candidatus Lokiarchaeota archaeon]
MSSNQRTSKSDVFVGGQEGFPVYRIPSLVVTRKGTLLAFCEGRQSISDTSQNAIVLKRSADGGETWEPLQAIARVGRDSLNNPQAVAVRETGRVILFFQRYPYPSNERTAVSGFSASRLKRLLGFRALDSWSMHSDDEGATWSAPVDVTRQVKPPAPATSIASGPGIGIQLRHGNHAGRLLMPFNCGPFGRWRVYCAFSDDAGGSWRLGQLAPEPGPGHANEVQVVERADGSVLLNARNQRGVKRRKVATSDDGGVTWSPLAVDGALVDPGCQGSIIRHSDPQDGKGSTILFANPASDRSRENGTLRASFDEGKTWPVAKVIEPGRFAYCCLGTLPDKRVACLYETGDKSGYEKVVLASTPLGT